MGLAILLLSAVLKAEGRKPAPEIVGYNGFTLGMTESQVRAQIHRSRDCFLQGRYFAPTPAELKHYENREPPKLFPETSLIVKTGTWVDEYSKKNRICKDDRWSLVDNVTLHFKGGKLFQIEVKFRAPGIRDRLIEGLTRKYGVPDFEDALSKPPCQGIAGHCWIFGADLVHPDPREEQRNWPEVIIGASCYDDKDCRVTYVNRRVEFDADHRFRNKVKKSRLGDL